MKRQARNPEKFQVLDIFSAMASEHGYDLTDPASVDNFVERVKTSLEKSKQSKTTIFGKRVESLFAYVVGALGECKLLKQEDSGDIYFSGTEVLAPDYRLVMADSSQIFVEVKNFHSEDPAKKFTLNKEYYGKLKNYSDLNNLELLFAVYFSAWNQWTLLPINAFEESEEEFSIDLPSALAKSEMLRLGDMIIGASPDLELRLSTSLDEAAPIDANGNTELTPRTVEIYCAGREVVDDAEKRIAFYLMRFGDWPEIQREPIIQNNRLTGLNFTYSPREKTEPNFSFIGRLSTMVSNGFRELTIKDGDIVALSLGIDPAEFSVLIPDDYKGKDLPLWRFKIEANSNFIRAEQKDGSS